MRYGYQKNTRQVRREPARRRRTRSARSPTSTTRSSPATPRRCGSDSLNEFLFQYTKFDNAITRRLDQRRTLVLPLGRAPRPEHQHPADRPTRRSTSTRTTSASRRRSAAAPTTSRSASTTSSRADPRRRLLDRHRRAQFTCSSDASDSPVTDITHLRRRFGRLDAGRTSTASTSRTTGCRTRPADASTSACATTTGTGFDLDQRTNPIWQTLSTQTRYNEAYLQDFQGGKGGVLKNDKNNCGPRLGFTYDLKGDGKQLLRGGWGIYLRLPLHQRHDPLPGRRRAVQLRRHLQRHTTPTASATPNGTFFQARPAAAAEPAARRRGRRRPTRSPRRRSRPRTPGRPRSASRTAHRPGSRSASTVASRLPRHPVPLPGQPEHPARPPRRFPDFGNFRLWYGNGHRRLQRAQLQRPGAAVQHASRFRASTPIEDHRQRPGRRRRVPLDQPGYQPDLAVGRDVSVNPLNPLCGACIGPLNTDARHRLTVAGVYTFPREVVLAGTFRARSATPYTIHAGIDLNGDGFRIDLPPGVAHQLGARQRLLAARSPSVEAVPTSPGAWGSRRSSRCSIFSTRPTRRATTATARQPRSASPARLRAIRCRENSGSRSLAFDSTSELPEWD